MYRARGRITLRHPLLSVAWVLWLGYFPCDAGASEVASTTTAPETRSPSASPDIRSGAALIFDATQSSVLLSKNSDIPLPVASITKLMTALVVLEGGQSLEEEIVVTADDRIVGKGSSSRLPVGARLTRGELLRLALMSSENRAANILARRYPGGLREFVFAMNLKAFDLGMTGTRFVDSTGLSSNNVATAADLAKLVLAASRHPIIREYSTTKVYGVPVGRKRLVEFRNTNRFVSDPNWNVALQKTGYLNEAGKCVVMQADIEGETIIFVLLNSVGDAMRTADARRMRAWTEDNMTEGWLYANASSRTTNSTLETDGGVDTRPAAVFPAAMDGALAKPQVDLSVSELSPGAEAEMAAFAVAAPASDRPAITAPERQRFALRRGNPGKFR